MDILASNYQPLKTNHACFNKKFLELASESDNLNIAVGYISEKSLDELASIIHKRGKPYCNLIIGMHNSEKFTRPQFAAAKEIEKFLSENNLGEVKLVTSFPFHGKLYCFSKSSGKMTSMIGSSNLDNILSHKALRKYELDILIDDDRINQKFKKIIDDLYKISKNLHSLDIVKFKEQDNYMENLDGVEKVSATRLEKIRSELFLNKSMVIPVKSFEEAPHSNVNVCFGKGRENKNTKIIKSRSWYEIELIVPKKVTGLPSYPGNGKIAVITDDGYKFDCKISGDYSKNFRSGGDLKTLGRWLKGRLQNAGFLEIGKPVTQEILQLYKRDYVDLIPSKNRDIWFLDFGVRND